LFPVQGQLNIIRLEVLQENQDSIGEDVVLGHVLGDPRVFHLFHDHVFRMEMPGDEIDEAVEGRQEIVRTLLIQIDEGIDDAEEVLMLLVDGLDLYTVSGMPDDVFEFGQGMLLVYERPR